MQKYFMKTYSLNTPRIINLLMCLFLMYMLLLNYSASAIQKLIDSQFIVLDLFIYPFIIFVVPIVAYLIVSKVKICDVFPISKVSFKNIAYIFGMIVMIQPLIILLSSLANFLPSNIAPDNTSNFFQILDAQNINLFLILLSTACMPALLEELMFRGIISNSYKKHSLLTVSIVSGLFFGMMHLDLNQLLYTVPLGFLLTLFVHYTGSLLASIIGHFFFNANGVLLNNLLSLSKESVVAPLEPAGLGTNLLPLLSILFIFFTLFIILFVYFIKYNGHSIKNIHKEIYSHSPKHSQNELNNNLTITNKSIKSGSFFLVFVVYIIAIFIKLF